MTAPPETPSLLLAGRNWITPCARGWPSSVTFPETASRGGPSEAAAPHPTNGMDRIIAHASGANEAVRTRYGIAGGTSETVGKGAGGPACRGGMGRTEG